MRFLIESPLVLGPLLVVYLAVVLTRRRRWTTLGTLSRLAAGMYVAAVLHFTLFPIEANFGFYRSDWSWDHGLNLVPITTIDTLSFQLNIAMTVPLGVFLVLLRERSTFWQAALVGLVTSLAIEISQLAQLVLFDSFRSADVNDLIANTLGCVLGYLVASLVRKQLSPHNGISSTTWNPL